MPDFTPGTRRRGRQPNPLRPLALELEQHADYLEQRAAVARAAASALKGARAKGPFPAIEALRDPAYKKPGRRV